MNSQSRRTTVTRYAFGLMSLAIVLTGLAACNRSEKKEEAVVELVATTEAPAAVVEQTPPAPETTASTQPAPVLQDDPKTEVQAPAVEEAGLGQGSSGRGH